LTYESAGEFIEVAAVAAAGGAIAVAVIVEADDIIMGEDTIAGAATTGETSQWVLLAGL